VIVACLALSAPAAAQEDTALTTSASLHKEPDGVPLVTLPAGAPVEAGRTRGSWNEATVEGWIYTNSTERTRRDGYDLVVTTDEGENLRRSPNGPVVGRVREGTLLERVRQKGQWTRVRRNGWIPRQALRSPAARQSATPQPAAARQQAAAPQQPAAPRPRPAGATAAGAPTPVSAPGPNSAQPPGDPERIQTARETPLGATPAGGTLGTLQAGTPARIVARSGELVKVQVEGWIPADAVAVSDSGALVGVSAAEVRAEPARFVGQTLEWRLQVIAVKTADQLRSEMPPGQPYLLTRGPLPEPGFVYVIIPSAQAAAFQALPPLQEVVLRVAIRAARTRFLTTPVAELVSVVSGMEGT
jgi:SH3 domain-containing protein